jgi:thiamine biosynthesis lipoprotein
MSDKEHRTMADSEAWASFPAFGGTAIVGVVAPEQLQAACEAAQQIAAEVDLACSRFREDSELSALNRAHGSAVRASPLFLEAVAVALRAARLTDGDVDPTVGQALLALGYDRDFALVREDGQRASVSFAAVAGWRTVEIDHANRTVRLHRDVRLDLGATAKALAADRAAAAAHAQAGCGVLVSFGGDIALAGPAPADGWRVRVTDDHRSGIEAPGQWITLRSGALATSSTSVRRWTAGEVTLHHVIDPSDGRPAAAVWRTISVAAANCVDANIATTAAIVRGARAVPWLQMLRLPSRLVTEDGTALHLAGWPEDGDDLEPYALVTEALA